MPAMDGGRHIVGVEAKVASASATPRYQVTQRDRSCAGKTTERGTILCLTGCREAVITNVARFRAPADVSCASEGSEDVHGHATGRNRSRERGSVSASRQQLWIIRLSETFVTEMHKIFA